MELLPPLPAHVCFLPVPLRCTLCVGVLTRPCISPSEVQGGVVRPWAVCLSCLPLALAMTSKCSRERYRWFYWTYIKCQFLTVWTDDAAGCTLQREKMPRGTEIRSVWRDTRSSRPAWNPVSASYRVKWLVSQCWYEERSLDLVSGTVWTFQTKTS